MDGIVGHKKLNVKGNYPAFAGFIINPERNASVNSNVRKLLGVKEVDEVYVTEGYPWAHRQGHTQLRDREQEDNH